MLSWHHSSKIWCFIICIFSKGLEDKGVCNQDSCVDSSHSFYGARGENREWSARLRIFIPGTHQALDSVDIISIFHSLMYHLCGPYMRVLSVHSTSMRCSLHFIVGHHIRQEAYWKRPVRGPLNGRLDRLFRWMSHVGLLEAKEECIQLTCPYI